MKVVYNELAELEGKESYKEPPSLFPFQKSFLAVI